MKLELITNYEGLEIELKGLGQVNYLVGKNGSGKSRILKSIEKEIPNNTIVCNLDKKLKLTDITIIDTHSNDEIGTMVLANGKIANKIMFKFVDVLDIFFEDFIKENTIQKSVLLELIRRGENQTNISKIIYKNQTFNFYDGNEKLFESIRISDGFEKLFGFLINIDSALEEVIIKNLHAAQSEMRKTISGPRIKNINFTIDEIENHLHPGLIKKVPIFLEWKINKAKMIQSINIQFFISTHSPFLISALSNPVLELNHKVYLIENGKTKGIDEGNKLNTSLSKVGFSGEMALPIVNQMLGSTVNDLMPRKILLAESSICDLLKEITIEFKQKKLNYTIQRTSGDVDSIKQAKTLIHQKNIYNLGYDEILILLDGKTNKDISSKIVEANWEDWVKVLSPCLNNYDSDEISNDELEKYYDLSLVNEFIKSKKSDAKAWNPSLKKFKDFIKEPDINYFGLEKLSEGKDNREGKIKAELAEYIVSNSNFEKLSESLPIIRNLFS